MMKWPLQIFSWISVISNGM